MNQSQSHMFETKFGKMGLAFDSSGINRIILPGYSDAELKDHLKKYGDLTTELNGSLKGFVSAIQKYFEGKLKSWDGFEDLLSWPKKMTASQKKVLKTSMRIPFSKTVSYSELAKLSGFPKGARFVGNTLAKNPFPLIVPCHRVLAQNRKIGGFSAPNGGALKRRLLSLEGCNLFH